MISKYHFRIKKNGSPYWDCFCRTPELIENYDLAIADDTQIWDCHHKNELTYTKQELIELGLYYDCSPDELIFLTREMHNDVHHRGTKHSSSTKSKMSKSMKGKNIGHVPWNKGTCLSSETKNKISKAHKNKPSWTKGTHWYNNGIIQMRAFECPEGFILGVLSK